jgi:hypothetical protein
MLEVETKATQKPSRNTSVFLFNIETLYFQEPSKKMGTKRIYLCMEASYEELG